MKTRDKILDLSIELIQQHGLMGWSYEDISSAIGIKKASIHYHFPKKLDLVFEAARHYVQKVQMEFEKISKTQAPVDVKLKRVADLYYRVYETENRTCLCLILTQNLLHLPDEVKREIGFFFNNLRKGLATMIDQGIRTGLFREDISSEAASELFLSSLQGLLVLGCHEVSGVRFNKAMNFFLSHLKK